jgi:hypothetical protein
MLANKLTSSNNQKIWRRHALCTCGGDGRIHIEKINGPFLYEFKATPDEYSAGLDLAIATGWLLKHESGTYVKFTQAGADLFS